MLSIIKTVSILFCRWVVVVIPIWVSSINAHAANKFYIYFFDEGTLQNGLYLSGDGQHLAGVSDGRIWIWSPDLGTRLIGAVPLGYFTDSLALNMDGSVLAGLFLPKAGSEPARPKLFRWTSGSSVRMLARLPDKDSISSPIHISNSGKYISFYCFDVHSESMGVLSPCLGSPFPVTKNPSPAKLWTTETGYTNLTIGNNRMPFYVRPSGDWKTFLLGSEGPGVSVENFRIEHGGVYTPINIKNYSMDLFYEAQAPLGIVSNDTISMLSVVTQGEPENSEVWDTSAGISLLPSLPKPCNALIITAISDEKSIFGKANCYNKTIGFRITRYHIELIAKWLNENGLKEKFPQDMVVEGVSADGKTIIGTYGNRAHFIGELFGTPDARPSLSSQNSRDKPPYSSTDQIGFGMFVAHVP